MTDSRPICVKCNKNFRAINYKKADKIYYRSLCDACLVVNTKRSKLKWIKKGYKKKLMCEACKFIPKSPNQLTVINFKDNFKTICLNCECIISDQIFSNVTPDF
jgi:hypothetical protein